MSESDQVPETSIAPNKMWTTKMEDGQLQIVEVTPFDKSEDDITDATEMRVLKDENEYTTQIVETNKGLMQLDLLNMTLVRCDESETDGNESYRLCIGSEGSEMLQEEFGTVTCVLQRSDGDSDDEEDTSKSFIVTDGDKQSYICIPPKPSATKTKKKTNSSKSKLSPTDILQNTKAVQRAKAAMNLRPPLRGRPGRRKMDSTPTIQDIISSSTLKLYLYSCKMCSFKCNAIKDLSAHRKKEHSSGTGRGKGLSGRYSSPMQSAGSTYRTTTHSEKKEHGSSTGRGKGLSGRYSSPMQCAGCTYRATTHSELIQHVKSIHGNDNTEIVVARSSADVTRLLEEGDKSWGINHVLVCGACGIETSTAEEFKAHPCAPVVPD